MAALALSSADAHAQWSDLGLRGHAINRLRSGYGSLYACTNDGLYRKASATPDSSWVLLGFAGEQVFDVVSLSLDTLLVARFVTGMGADTVAMLQSIDGGMNWSAFQNGFGADGPSNARKVTALLSVPGTILAASSDRVGKSTDAGMTWEKVSGGGGYKYTFLAAGPLTLWAGGETALFTPVLLRSINGGEDWEVSPIHAVSSDPTFGAMAFDPSNGALAFLGMGDGLYKTNNSGNSWTRVSSAGTHTMFGVGARAVSPLRVYVNGSSASPSATFQKSDDGGSSWSLVSAPSSGGTYVTEILVHSGTACDTLFLGTTNGILRYLELELVGVGASWPVARVILSAQPNVTRGTTTLRFVLPWSAPVSLRILDSGGREVATLLLGERPAGQHHVPWDVSGLPSGAYFCELRAGRARVTQKVLVVK